jgi:hypothetical protein
MTVNVQKGLRAGTSALEVVMATAVGVPLAAMLFFLGVKMCRYVHGALSGLVTWPFL